MRFGSLFSGIEAASVAFEPLGWSCQWVAERDPFASAVLAHHYPTVPNLGDVTQVDWEKYHGTIDVLVGGPPCQSFSIAGLRAGLQDPRGNLALEFIRIASIVEPRWFIFENVPGILSSGQGRDFGSILGAMVECRYGIAYRVLDAQFFGVPQRRRRVFVVGYLGNAERAAQVLFDTDGVCRHSHKIRPKGEVSPTLPSRGTAGVGFGTDFDCDGGLIAFDTTQITSAENRSNPQVGDPCHPLAARGHAPAIAFSLRGRDGESQIEAEPDGISPALRAVAGGSSHTFIATSAVRRITPIEAEKLQGFPPNYTLVPYRGKLAADGNRYKAIGNSMAVPVMRWIGDRIAMVESLSFEKVPTA